MTASLFPLNQQQNDQLILDAEARRRDLIEFAVHRFAPHLNDMSDVKVVHLYSTNASLRKEIRAVCGGKTIVVEHVLAGTKKLNVNEVQQNGVMLDLPAEADFVATRSGLNTKVEWLSARLKALPIVLPEAIDYMLGALKKGGVLVIVGAEQAR